MIRALVIDDEAGARADLRAMLAAHPEVSVVGEAATIRAARERLAQADYELVFLDVQLMGGTGFDLVPDVKGGAQIIFVTAFSEHALRAFEVNALDYLLKPVKATRLAESLARVAARRASAAAAMAATEAPRAEGAIEERAKAGGTSREDGAPRVDGGQALRRDDVVYLSSGSHARFAPVMEISAIMAQENYSLVRLVDSTQVLVRRTLKAWEDMLPPQEFARVHRTVLVNLKRIARYERDAPKSVLLYLSGVPEPVPVSRRLWSDVRERMGQHFPAA